MSAKARRASSSWRPSTRPGGSRMSRGRSRASDAARRGSGSTRPRGGGSGCWGGGRRAPRASACRAGATSARGGGARGCSAAARPPLGLRDGRYERMRVCDAVLSRRGLPLYPVPAAEEPAPDWMQVGFELFAALAPLGLYIPDGAAGTLMSAVGSGAIRSGRVFETYPDAIFCALLGHRPPPKRTPWGGQQRIAALKLKGVVDDDGGLWHRTLDEIDACAAAYAAYALAVGLGTWVGDPAEGVMVIPTARLLERYTKLPAPARSALA